MNANDLWSGQDYAYVENISRGILYYAGAHRVKVMRVYQAEMEYGRKKATTMVEVWPLDEEGNIRTRDDGTEITKSIRARQIFMRWEEYAEETRVRKEREEVETRERNERNAKARGFNSYEEWQADIKRKTIEEEDRRNKARLEREERERQEELRRQELRRLEEEGKERILQLFERNGFNRAIVKTISPWDITLNREMIDEMLMTEA